MDAFGFGYTGRFMMRTLRASNNGSVAHCLFISLSVRTRWQRPRLSMASNLCGIGGLGSSVNTYTYSIFAFASAGNVHILPT